MTSGERMLFAVAFDRRLDDGCDPGFAAVAAKATVHALRRAGEQEHDLDTRAMLDDMLSTGADR